MYTRKFGCTGHAQCIFRGHAQEMHLDDAVICVKSSHNYALKDLLRDFCNLFSVSTVRLLYFVCFLVVVRYTSTVQRAKISTYNHHDDNVHVLLYITVVNFNV